MSLPTSRKEAAILGEKYYQTNKPCKNGHKSKRHVSGYCCECMKIYTKDYYEKNKEKMLSATKEWVKKNPEKHRNNILKNRVSEKTRIKARENAIIQFHKRRKVEGSFTKFDIDDLYLKQRGSCPYCFKNLKKEFHIDHIKPISKGGTNWPDNLQLTCPTCNMQKAALSHEEFLALQKLKQNIP